VTHVDDGSRVALRSLVPQVAAEAAPANIDAAKATAAANFADVFMIFLTLMCVRFSSNAVRCLASLLSRSQNTIN
jgi:hypothetical protein